MRPAQRGLLVLPVLCLALATAWPAAPDAASRPAKTEGSQAPRLRLAFVGDVMLGRGVAQALAGHWESAFADVAQWLETADVAVANLESPLTMAPLVASGHDLRAGPEAGRALGAAGLDIVSLANNHALDAGQAGLTETIAALAREGIAAVHAAPGGVRGVSSGGLSIPPSVVVLALDDSQAPVDVGLAARSVSRAADEGVAVIVSIHWGGEYQAAPSARQRAVARPLASAGATVIVGHGPHVPQPVEWVDGALVAYSLGNFLFDQPYPADCRWGAILVTDVMGAKVVAANAIPTVSWKGRTSPAQGTVAAAISERLGLDLQTGDGSLSQR